MHDDVVSRNFNATFLLLYGNCSLFHLLAILLLISFLSRSPLTGNPSTDRDLSTIYRRTHWYEWPMFRASEAVRRLSREGLYGLTSHFRTSAFFSYAETLMLPSRYRTTHITSIEDCLRVARCTYDGMASSRICQALSPSYTMFNIFCF